MTEVHQDPQGSAAQLADAAVVGTQLRRAREARGETTADVAYALKLTGRQIEAMEAGRLDLLPGAAFARGFLRNYARYLGIDATAVLAGFDREAAAAEVELLPVSNAQGVMPSGRGGRAVQLPVALIAALLLLVMISGWYFDWFAMPGTEVAVSEPASVSEPTHAGEVVSPSGVAPAPAAEVVPLAAPAVVVSPSVAPSPPSAAAPLPVVPAPQPATAAVPAVMPAPVQPVPVPMAAVPADAPRANGVEHLVFRFEGESWIEVRDASGAIVYSGVSAAGSSRTVQGKPPFALVVGNARQVSLEYRGKPYDLLPHVRVSVARLNLE